MLISALAKLIKKQQHKKQILQFNEAKQGNPQAISSSLKENIEAVQKIFKGSCDLILREFSFGKGDRSQVQAALFFIDGLVNISLINDSIIKPLMHDSRISQTAESPLFLDMDMIKENLLITGDVVDANTYDDIVDACLSGDAVLLVDGFCQALDIAVKGWEKRAVTEPITEVSVRGPREGFTESLRTNTAMIRRKIKDPALKIEPMVIGRRSNTKVNILYLDGLVNPDLITEVRKRLQRIDADAILATGYLESYIEDSTFSVFPTIWYSEKPDAIAGKMLEGRVAIAVDGTPFVLTIPMLFIENFQSTEDYIKRTPYAITVRLLRFMAFIISLFTPALYIALSTYHQELIPTTLLFTMAAANEGVPFPVVIEMSIMMVVFEILQEAGMRMPRPVGQTISIVGALVMGEAAVRAGLVGAPVVIVIALTAVSSYAVPFSVDGVSLLRWLLLALSAFMGIYGITLGSFAICIHLTSLKSFGTPYLMPIAPFQQEGMQDTFIRAPLWSMKKRPRSLKPQDLIRQNTDISLTSNKQTQTEEKDQ